MFSNEDITHLIRTKMLNHTGQVGVSADSNSYIWNWLGKPRFIHHNYIKRKVETKIFNESIIMGQLKNGK